MIEMREGDKERELTEPLDLPVHSQNIHNDLGIGANGWNLQPKPGLQIGCQVPITFVTTIASQGLHEHQSGLRNRVSH